MTPEEMLRQALAARAETVDVAPAALGTIRSRIASRAQRRRRTLMFSIASAATSVATTVVAVMIFAGSCTPSGGRPVPPATGTAVPTSSAPSSVAPSSAPPSTAPSTAPGTGGSATPAGGGQTVAMPVYYVGTSAGRPVLYREYRPVPLTDDTPATAIAAALTEMFANRAADRDYWSPFMFSTGVRDVRLVDGVAVIDLSEADGPPGTPVPTP